jgi:hypothetical protein
MNINGKIINLIVGDFAGIENEFICNDNTLQEMSEQKNTLSKNVDENGEKETFYMHQPILNKDLDNFDTIRGGGEQIQDIAFDNNGKTNIDEQIDNIEIHLKDLAKNTGYFSKIQTYHNETMQAQNFLQSFGKKLNIYDFVNTIIMENYDSLFKDEYKDHLKNSEELKKLNETKKNNSDELTKLIDIDNTNIENKISVPSFSDIFKKIDSDVSDKFADFKFINISDHVYLYQDDNLYSIIRNITIFGEICKYLNEYSGYINDIYSANNLTEIQRIVPPTRSILIARANDKKSTIVLNTLNDVYKYLHILFDASFNQDISNDTNKLQYTLFYINNEIVVGSNYIKAETITKKTTLFSNLPQDIYLNFTYYDTMTIDQTHTFSNKHPRYAGQTKKVSARKVEPKIYCNVDIITEIKKLEKDINELIQSRTTYFSNSSKIILRKNTLTREIIHLKEKINKFIEENLKNINLSNIDHVYKYFIKNQNELFKYFYLTILKKYMLYTACNNRREEGIWINSSLENIRKAIQYIVQSKDFNIFYNYIDSCLSNKDQHYSPENLGLLIKQEELKEELDNNIFISLIHKNLSFYRGGKETYNILQMAKDMVICVYCVFNFSPKINDPPKSPYYNINFLNEIRNVNDLKNIIRDTDKKIKFLNKLKRLYIRTENDNNLFNKDTIDIFKKANVLAIEDDEKEAFPLMGLKIDNDVLLNELINIILNSILENSKSDDDKIFDVTMTGIRMICREINIINATSSMGSLEFIDQIAKLNTTQYLCEYNESNNDISRFIDVTTKPKK